MRITQITPAAKRLTTGVCTLLLLTFAINSYSAALTKNATIDEPTHALAGWLGLRQFDFRLETVNPPLWKCWAAMGNLFSGSPIAHETDAIQNMKWDPADEVELSSRALFGTSGIDGQAFVNRSRAMMLLLAIALGR